MEATLKFKDTVIATISWLTRRCVVSSSKVVFRAKRIYFTNLIIIGILSLQTTLTQSKCTGITKEELGHNCDMDTIITSRDTCENALQSLELTPLNLDVNSNYLPAGCYWKSDNNGYFNNVVDPSLTNTKFFGERGGVCSTMGKNF